MRASKFRINIQVLLVALFAFAAPIGYILSDLVLSGVSEMIVGLAAAFAGGSLLYIATTDLLPVIHSTSKNKYLSVLFFLIGVAIMTLFASHHHEHHEGTEVGHDLHEDGHGHKD